MKWDENDSQTSSDIEDRRGMGGGGGGGGFRFGGGRMGLGGMVILLVLSLVFKRNFFALVGGGESTVTSQPASGPARSNSVEEAKLVKFVSFVLDDLQNTWEKELPKQANVNYPRAKLVLFSGATQSACGMGESAMGPFYCPGDQKVYIDLSFYQELRQKFGAPGDFAQAYVLAHEVGHHLQNVLGTEKKVRREQRIAKDRENELSVRMELQADCYAGVWGNLTKQRGVLEAGDLEEALRAANAIGDDTLQKQASGRVRPEKFTHGSAAQRMKWFRSGFDSGRLDACDTFKGMP